MSEIIIDKDNFDSEVEKSEIPVIVDFWADWCMPCHMLEPVIEELSKEYEGKVKVGKLNIDENPTIASRYSVMSIPSVVFFNQGKEVTRLIGVRGKQDFVSEIDKLI